jgi:hypothetical protein
LVEQARRQSALSIGIGDNGNEIGFGLIEKAVREVKPYGDKCQCSCGMGIASAIETDVLVSANISNWGAYGVEAMLAALLGVPALLHSAETETAMLEAAVDAGALDGSTGGKRMAVDGCGLDVQQAELTMLRAILENGLADPPRRPF